MSAITEQPTNGFGITPDNNLEIGSGTRTPGINAMPVAGVGAILYIGTAGSVKVTTEGGSTITFTSVPAGFVLPVKCVKLWADGTTSTQIVALY